MRPKASLEGSWKVQIGPKMALNVLAAGMAGVKLSVWPSYLVRSGEYHFFCAVYYYMSRSMFNMFFNWFS